MPRSTLKLPAKSAPPDDAWSPPRKPLRGGVKGKKASPGSKRNPPAPPRPTPASEPGVTAQAAPTPRVPKPPPRGVAAKGVAAPLRPQATPADAAPPPKKAYPKRGIARSTGARALPPPRIDGNAPWRAGEAPAAAVWPAAAAAQTPPQPPHPPAAHPPLAQPTSTPPAGPAAAAVPRRPLAEPPRLAKRVAEMALCSRRQADEWIENGWVSVDGVVVTTLGVRVHAKAKIEITDAAKAHQSEAVTIIYNRPPADDATPPLDAAGQLPRALIRDDNRWTDDETRIEFKPTHLRGLAPAGKLDSDASGMLVFTQEGSVARRITGDETRLEKEYVVRVNGQLDAEGLARLAYGLELDGVKLKRAQVSWQNEQQLRFVLHETRKRQIERMCELVGLRVVGIKRIRIGSVSLGKLPAGQWRYLRNNERF